MNKKNTLPKNHEVAVEVACDLLLQSPHLDKVEPGSILRVVIETPFKAEAHWYSEKADGPLLKDHMPSTMALHRERKNQRILVVDRALNVLTHRWRRWRLHNRLFLRPLRSADKLHPELALLKSRQLFI